MKKITIPLLLIFFSSLIYGQNTVSPFQKTISELRLTTSLSSATHYYTTDPGQEGFWRYDPSDVTSADNTGTVIVSSNGKRFKRIITGAINVKWFGAKGDSSQDDRAYIQAAIDFGITLKKATIYFPSGKYLANTYYGQFGQDNIIFNIAASSPDTATIHFVGDAGTIITTPLAINTNQYKTYIFFVQGVHTGLQINGITFINTHGITHGTTVAIGLFGGTNPSISNVLVSDCGFQNFSAAIWLYGATNVRITKSKFTSSLGHDSGNDENNPNVSIYSYLDSYVTTSNVTVDNNYFDGCLASSVSGNTVPGALDGFAYGQSYGWNIYNNTIYRNGVEAIFAVSSGGNYPTVIEGNNISSDRVIGQTDGTYGIRSDEPNTIINGNNILNAQQGILAAPSSRTINYNVTNNNITLPTYNSYSGIELWSIVNGNVSNNTVSLNTGTTNVGDNFYGLVLHSDSAINVNGNVINRTGAATAGKHFTGIYIDSQTVRSAKISINNNRLNNVDTAFLFGNHSEIQLGINSILATVVLAGDSDRVSTGQIPITPKTSAGTYDNFYFPCYILKFYQLKILIK